MEREFTIYLYETGMDIEDYTDESIEYIVDILINNELEYRPLFNGAKRYIEVTGDIYNIHKALIDLTWITKSITLL